MYDHGIFFMCERFKIEEDGFPEKAVFLLHSENMLVRTGWKFAGEGAEVFYKGLKAITERNKKIAWKMH